MKYTIYKITNIINDKIYIGKHQTKDPYDDYMGSGLYLKRAIKKYGVDRFEKKVLYIFDKKEDMDLMEAEIVDAEFIIRSDTYNLKLGGEGGFDYLNETGKNIYDTHSERWEETRLLGNIKRAELFKDEEYGKEIGRKISEALEKYFEENPNHFLGKKHTDESKKKIGKANAIQQKGKKNSQYGTCWIYSESSGESTKIKKEDLSFHLARGWKKGRKMK